MKRLGRGDEQISFRTALFASDLLERPAKCKLDYPGPLLLGVFRLCELSAYVRRIHAVISSRKVFGPII
jgi:hypothetical protein